MATTLEQRAEPVAQTFDRTALKVNQAAIIALLIVAFITNFAWLVVFVAAVMVLGTFSPQLALFQRLYRDLLRPAGLLRPDLHVEDAAPHRFAQGFGGAVLCAASLALFTGFSTFGLALVLLVIVLAVINLAFGFCAGCFVYLQLSRLRRAR